MTPSIRLLIVHEQQLHRQCLVAALAATERFSVVACAGSTEEALKLVRDESFDVVVADWDLQDRSALDLTRRLTDEFPTAKVLILGLTETPECVHECIEAGACGYVRKDETLDHLLTRIEQVLRGETVCSPAIARHLLSRLTKLAREQRHNRTDGAVLTVREMEILRLIADGLGNKQIASRLCLSLHTVKNHVHNLLEKLSAKGRIAAVQYAYANQWLTH
jgi:two-component system NarL family response regulator